MYIPKDLPNSCNDVSSRIEDSKWLLRGLKVAQDNLALDLKLSRLPSINQPCRRLSGGDSFFARTFGHTFKCEDLSSSPQNPC